VIEEVIIYNLVDGIFFAKLICNDGKKTAEIDARTSDAIALAVRYQCPIYTYEFILASAGIMIEGTDFAFLENIEPTDDAEGVSIPGNISSGYASYTEAELKEQLDKALEEENYEKAARIRDEISKRQ
jgi:bifunctional DNase/RNase